MQVTAGDVGGEERRVEVGARVSAPFWKQAQETQTLDMNLESRFSFNNLHMTSFPKEIYKFTIWNWKAKAGKIHLFCIWLTGW